ncbi:Golgi transport complex subunit 5-domain-containing protein [Diplogelasinospora grovesii]|uniref:Conserved oligomeric Golgi complex subunit 5 n=1 Tax=Diplogelasinospora grovesii TaxID=303347 RepID=A0AAN6N0N7_9PEZI|nr:Golgi transport complex subunit 5-domain-containing protein [Diplogelasinospora grovesii]
MATGNNDEEPSYIDYETFLDPGFSPSSFANTLVLATNNPNDAPLDLSTPLSRVLFDIQEIDSHIDMLTTRSAIPLLSHTEEQNEASGRIVGELDTQIKALNDSYKQLEKEVIQKHAEAEEVRQVASRLWETLRLGRAVGRCLQLGRQLEVQHSELTPTASGSSSRKDGDHRALVRCTHTLLSLRELFASATVPGSEGFGLERVNAVRSLRSTIVQPTETSVRDTAERIIREFSTAGGSATFAQYEETKARTVSALTTLYLLSPTNPSKGERWEPRLMAQALRSYLNSATQSSIAGLSRGLAALPALDRALSEASARCQNVVALEAVLKGTKIPAHPLLKGTENERTGNMLQPLLANLETGSLASYFWRTLASSLADRVQEIVAKGGVSARTLKSNRDKVGEAVRECVIRGSQLPSAVAAGTKGKGRGGADGEKSGGWEREVAVMVGSVVGNLGR